MAVAISAIPKQATAIWIILAIFALISGQVFFILSTTFRKIWPSQHLGITMKVIRI